MRLLLLVLGVMLLWASSSEAACTGSGLTWTCPAGATSSDVQAVINAASDGATVTFAAGSYAWGNTYINLSTTNGITLDGGNRGAIVTVGSPGNVLALTGVTGDTSKLYRVTGFVFQNAPANIPFQIAPGTGSIIRRWRFDHNTLSNFDPNSVSLLGQNGPFPTVYGLIDNNLFTGSVNFMPFKVLGTGAPLAQASSVRGTGNNMFFEDNRFNFASETGATVGAGCVDAWNYAGLVFRFNTVLNCKVRVHDTLHAGGASNFEVYNNRLEANANSVTSDGYRLIHNQGSGENFYFGNAFYSATSLRAQAMEIGHYRSASCEGGSLYACSSSQPQCDGTNPNTSKYKDGHFSTTATYEGYVCWYQPGRMANGGANAYGSLSPVYTWMNVDANTGNKVSPAVVDFDTSRYWSTNHFLANRDFTTRCPSSRKHLRRVRSTARSAWDLVHSLFVQVRVRTRLRLTEMTVVASGIGRRTKVPGIPAVRIPMACSKMESQGCSTAVRRRVPGRSTTLPTPTRIPCGHRRHRTRHHLLHRRML